MILSFFLLVLLALSVLLNIGALVGSLLKIERISSGRSAGPRLDEVVVEDHGAPNKVALVRVEGMISGHLAGRGGQTMVDILKAQLKRAADDDKVRAVVLKIDSPGGEVLASDQIFRMIEQFQQDHRKPVVASLGSLAASGGYYVAAPCRWIVADELTITGSIGVIMSTWNYRGLMGKVGIQPYTYKSGRFKDMLSGAREPEEIPAEERAMVQALIDVTYEKFRSVVDAGRSRAAGENGADGRMLAANWRDFADGRIFSGREAHELGFVDELGGLDAAVARARRLAALERANVVEFRPRYELAQILGLVGRTDEHVLKVDLGIETPMIEAGRLYFLCPAYLH